MISVTLEQYTRQLGQGPLREPALAAAGLVRRTVGWRDDDPLGPDPERAITLRTLTLVIYALGRRDGQAPGVGQLDAWVAPYVRDAQQRPGPRIRTVTPVVGEMKAELAGLLERVGHQLSREGDRMGEAWPPPTEPVERMWWDLVTWTLPREDTADIWSGPNLGWGLAGATDVILAAAGKDGTRRTGKTSPATPGDA